MHDRQPSFSRLKRCRAMESQLLQSSEKLANELLVQLFKIAQRVLFQNLSVLFRETALDGKN
jgi:hypothetical protein